MAGDWIKMRSDLGTDPAVIRMSLQTSLDSFAVVGRLHALWSWADAHTVDGLVPGISAEWVDQFVNFAGFAEAMRTAGWLQVQEGGIEFPHFGRHMGDGAKARSLKTKRQKRWRSNGGSPRRRKVVESVDAGVDGPPPTKCLPEKRREEKRREEETGRPPNPPPAGPPPVEPFDPLREQQRQRDEFLGRWKAAGLRPPSRLSPSLQGRLYHLLADPWWSEHYPAALDRAGRIPFLATGTGRQKGPLDVAEFLTDDDLVRKLVDGSLDERTVGPRMNGSHPDPKAAARDAVFAKAEGKADG